MKGGGVLGDERSVVVLAEGTEAGGHRNHSRTSKKIVIPSVARFAAAAATRCWRKPDKSLR